MIKALTSITFLILLVLILSLASFFISESVVFTREEISAYECGFEHFSQSRLPFSFRYFLLTMIFLVFDMEIVFLLFLPETFISSFSSLTTLFFSFMFLVLLFFGLLYEWVDGSLDWVM